MDQQMEEAIQREGGARIRPLRADARRNRERILEVAWRLLVEMGPARFDMDAVAREAGVGKGTLYRHYANREALLEALVLDGARRIVEAMREHIAPEADAATKLRTMVSILYRQYEQHYINVELMVAVLSRAGRADRARKHSFVELRDRIRSIVAQGIREGLFRPLDLDYATVFVLAAINPFIYFRQQQTLGYDREQLAERAVDLLLHGLRAPDEGGNQ